MSSIFPFQLIGKGAVCVGISVTCLLLRPQGGSKGAVCVGNSVTCLLLRPQGGSVEIDGKYDKEDFQALLSAMQVLGFTSDEQDTIFKILASGKQGSADLARKDSLHQPNTFMQSLLKLT